ncbi:class I SAM-dependent methyltransferase [Cyanobium sp. FGCU-6]|nr:class I SAM-dependent methyltransferase [Cyanobium sp. FGCU6]
MPDNWLWLNEYEYPVVECIKCGSVYVNPRPTFEEIERFYPSGYHDGRDNEVHQKRYLNQYEYVKDIDTKSILDIGCARGDWLSYFQGRHPSADLYGVDAFSSGVSNDSIKFFRCALPVAKLPENHFGLITSWAVLEHVHSPNAYFKAVASLLSPGGKFVFLVTNSESIYGKYAYKEDIPRHLFHFNARSLDQYANKHGLKLDKIQYDERFWDGTGKGAFRHFARRLLGISWRQLQYNDIPFIKKLILKCGSILDKIVFLTNWEAKLKRSGIIVVTMTKWK